MSLPYRPMAYVGKPHSSSSLPDYPAAHAFRPQIIEGRKYWPWANQKDYPFPHSVWFEFEEPKFLTKIGFSTRVESDHIGQAPIKFEVIAALKCEDFLSNAEVLLTVEDAGFKNPDQAQAWLIPAEKQGPFLCIGIRIHSVQDVSKGFTSVQKLTMWEKRV